jgi:hypothetical protein
MSPNPLYAVCIQRAAQLLGGYDALGARLELSPKILRRWASGHGDAGETVFLRIVDILLDESIRAVPPQRGDSTSPTRDPRQDGA